MACNKEDSALEQAFDKIIHRLDSLCSRMDRLEENIARVKEDIDFAASNETLEEAGEEYANTREGRTAEVLDNFDFNLVERVMKFLDWKWTSIDGGSPTGWDVKVLAENLLRQAWADLDTQEYDESGWREWHIATGGLDVFVCESTAAAGDHRIASLKFVPEEWRAE